jgi:hypothetical protein
MNDHNKMLFLSYVVSTIKKEPDMLAPTILAIQQGVTDALIEERGEKANMAYALVTLVQDNPKSVKKWKHQLQKGLVSLAEFFRGAPVEAEIRRYIEPEAEE